MNLKELLKKDFGVDLPISGGNGNAIDNAIIIHKAGINDYVGTEYTILKYLGIGRNVTWQQLGNELLVDNQRIIDKIKIETREEAGAQIITQLENYYFDITECFGRLVIPEQSFDEDTTLRKIKDRFLELEQLNDFNKTCIDLLRSNALLADSERSRAFIDMLFTDECIRHFDDMMNNRRKPILQVLRMVGEMLKENPS